MKTPARLLTILVAGAFATLPLWAPAARAQAPAAATKPAATPRKGQATSSRYPFHGKIAAVDARAGTFTLEGKTPRVIAVTSQTRITKNGASAKLSDAVVGEDSGGMVQRGADGKLTAESARFGAKPAKGGAAAASTPATSGQPEPAAGATPAPKPARAKRKSATPAPTPAT